MTDFDLIRKTSAGGERASERESLKRERSVLFVLCRVWLLSNERQGCKVDLKHVMQFQFACVSPFYWLHKSKLARLRTYGVLLYTFVLYSSKKGCTSDVCIK